MKKFYIILTAFLLFASGAKAQNNTVFQTLRNQAESKAPQTVTNATGAHDRQLNQWWKQPQQQQTTTQANVSSDVTITRLGDDEPKSYDELAYPAIAVGESKTGTLSELVQIYYGVATAAGYSFSAQENKIYNVTINYTSPTDVYFNAGFFILKDLSGDFENNVIYSDGYDSYGMEQTVTSYFVSSKTGTLRILLADFNNNELNYTVVIEEVKAYKDINYPQINVGAAAVSGKLSNFVITNPEYNEMKYAAGYSFQAQAGKTYKITINYTSDTEIEMETGAYILKSGTMTGVLNTDRITSSWAYGTSKSLTLAAYLECTADGLYRILHFDWYDHKLDFTISVKETGGVIMYDQLNYNENALTVGANAVNGSLSKNVKIYDDEQPFPGAGHTFQAQTGKTYKVTVNYTSASAVFMNVWCVILKSGTLSGDIDADYLSDGWDRSFGTSLSIETYFICTETALYRILNADNALELNYSIRVEESAVKSYFQFNYNTNLAVHQEFSGSLSEEVLVGNSLYFAAGCNFQAQKGKTYKITVGFEAADDVEINPNVLVLTSGMMTGNPDDDILFWRDESGYGTATIEVYFPCNESGIYRILLTNRYKDVLNYTIYIEETDFKFYSQLDYSGEIMVDGEAVAGSLSENVFINIWNNPVKAAGHSFHAEKGKVYRISAKFEASDGWMYVGYRILKIGNLSGNIDNDQINDYYIEKYGTELTVGSYFICAETGLYHILLTGQSENELTYQISISLTDIELLTLPQLLSSTDQVVPYNEGMEYTDRGYTSQIVAGDDDLGFRNSGEIYYAESYKITLTAGAHIKIYSSRQGGDSYLYLYRADGAGGYVYVVHDDDGGDSNDSYINFTASVAGDYYIVITDYRSERAGRYYLTVWNTDGVRPDNSYVESYVNFDYHTILAVNQEVSGSLSDAVSVDGSVYSAAGYSFQAQKGKTYQITVGFETSDDINIYPIVLLLTNRKMTASDDDVLYATGDWGYKAVTLDFYFPCNEDGLYRILLAEYNGNELNYTIYIKEVDRKYYSQLDYSNGIIVDGAAVTGSLSETVWISQSDVNPETAFGHSFHAEKGKVYKIAVNFEASADVWVYSGFRILKMGYLSGNINNDLISEHYFKILNDEGYFSCPETGIYHVLLFDKYENELTYQISISQTDVISLPELLSRTGHVIPYSEGMAYTDRGITQYTVAGDGDIPFRYSGSVFYAESYKITLAAGDQIKIFSSRQDGDSYLLLYRADGSGGYENIDSNDDGGGGRDSYIDFSTSVSGDYYIVVTDYHPESMGRYYLTVWNTAGDRPDNFYAESYPVNFNVQGGNGGIQGMYQTLSGYPNDFLSGNSVEEGDLVIFTANPADGYSVKGWTLDGVPVNGTNLTFALKIAKEITVTVEFQLASLVAKHQVTFSAIGSGSIAAKVDDVVINSTDEIEEGKDIVFTATPGSGYRVKEWKNSGTVVSGNTGNTYTLSNIRAAATVTVEFEVIPPITYTVIFNVTGGNGSIAATVDGSGVSSGASVLAGKSVVFTANPNSGYRVKEWKNGGTVVTDHTTNTYTLPILLAATTVTVEFEAIPSTTYLVAFSVTGGNGSIAATVDGSSINTGASVLAGRSVVFTANPNSGYRVKEWKNGGSVVSGNTTYTYTLQNIAAAVSVTVEFEAISSTSHIVTFSLVGGNGRISAKVDGNEINSGAYVAAGKNVVFTAHPYTGYHVKEWKNGGSVVSGNKTNTYTLSITEAVTVTVEFEALPTNSEDMQSVNPLRAWTYNGQLRISGLTAGKTMNIYGVNGVLVYQSVATSDEMDVPLDSNGIYIIESDNHTVRVLFSR